MGSSFDHRGCFLALSVQGPKKMRFLPALLASAALATPLRRPPHLGSLDVPNHAASPQKLSSEQSPSALYFLNNDPKGGSIVSLQINEDGSLSDPQSIGTQGYGLQALFFTTGDDFPVDSTLSQGAVIVKENVSHDVIHQLLSTAITNVIVSLYHQLRQQHIVVIPHRPTTTYQARVVRCSRYLRTVPCLSRLFY